jgi:cytidine deaminase
MKYKNFIKKAKREALKSNCRYKISALGFNNKGELIYSSFNKLRFMRFGGGSHAEMNVMLKAGSGLKTIMICRVNRCGKMLPIDPCAICRLKANKLSIKIITIYDF